MQKDNNEHHSIFRKRHGTTNGQSATKRRQSDPAKPFNLTSSGSFESKKPLKRSWIGNQPRGGFKDEFDGIDRFQMINSGIQSHLFGHFSENDILSGSFNHLDGKMENLTDDGGVRKELLLKGDGKKIPPDSNVWVHYISFAEGNDEPFDSTRSRERLAPFKLTEGGIFRGFGIALHSMEVGEVSKFLFDPAYAYGKMGCPKLIPPNCRILFAIEVIKASMEDEQTPIYLMSPEERMRLDFKDLYKCADELRSAGNVKFYKREYESALDRYTKAEEILEQAFLIKKEDEILKDELRFKLFSNIAMSCLQLDMPREAIDACKLALAPDMPTPTNPKIYHRYALAAFKLRQYDVAWEFCQKAIDIQPRNWDLKMFQRQINAYIKKETAHQDELYKRMIAP